MYGKKRVVITGLGAVTPVGTDVETAWENIKKGVSGIGRLTRIDPELFPAKVAAEINDFEVEKYIDKKSAPYGSLYTICSGSSENGSCRCKT